MMKRIIKRIGFTLIELIVVILILGILAAVAVPRFVNLRSQANVAALMGLRAAVVSGADLAHGLHLAAGIPVVNTPTYVTIEGVQVQMYYGYPIAWDNGIAAAVRFDSSTFKTVGGNPLYFQVIGATDPTRCQITYGYGTPGPPIVTTLTDGC